MAAAPVLGKSQIRTPRCWEGLCGSSIGSKTMPIGFLRVSRMRPLELGLDPSLELLLLLIELEALLGEASVTAYHDDHSSSWEYVMSHPPPFESYVLMV